MPALAKGQNAPLQSETITISVALSAPADVSALLLTESGKVVPTPTSSSTTNPPALASNW